MGWDGIDHRYVVAHNQIEPSFIIVWSPQIIYYINILLHFLPLKLLRTILLPSTSRAMEYIDIAPLTYLHLLRYLGLWLFMPT